MRVSVHLGSSRPRHKVERRVPRNRHNHHYRRSGGSRSGGGSSSSSPWKKLLVGLIVVAMCSLVLFLVINNQNKTKDYIETNGYVVDWYDSGISDSGQYMYSEIVEYEVDGKFYEVTSSSSSNYPLPYGSPVKVYYNPVNPRVAFVNQKATNILAYVICGIVGFAGLCVVFSGFKDLLSGSND